MTVTVDERTLEFAKGAIGGRGKDSPQTIFEDGILRQSFDMRRVASSAFDLGVGPGLFSGSITSAHVAAGTVTEDLDPYDPGTTIGVLPLVVAPPLEWYFLGASSQVLSTTQTIVEVECAMRPVLEEGFNDGVAGTPTIVLARWDTLIAGTLQMTNVATGAAFQSPNVPLRWSRNNRLRFVSTTTGVGATSIKLVTWFYLGRRGLTPSAF